jgi:hypothetical protein
MVSDDDEQSKISKQVDDYERFEGECFSKPGAIREIEIEKIIVSFKSVFLIFESVFHYSCI